MILKGHNLGQKIGELFMKDKEKKFDKLQILMILLEHKQVL